MKLVNITRESFAPFGTLVEFSEHPENDLFEIVAGDPDMPWRIAMLRVVRRAAERLERHVNSFETFEPVSGMGVLLCALPDSPEDYTAFLLDRPVCVNKAVWHEVFTLSEQSFYKLTENYDVPCEYYDLPAPVSVSVE